MTMAKQQQRAREHRGRHGTPDKTEVFSPVVIRPVKRKHNWQARYWLRRSKDR